MPYIGITGPTTQAHIDGFVSLRNRLNPIWPQDYHFMNGVLVSQKTLTKQPPSNPNLYPALDVARRFMIEDGRFYNVIHFNTRDPQLYGQLVALTQLFPGADAIQLNLTWPSEQQLRRYRERDDALKIILQVGRDACDQVARRPDWLAYRLLAYEGLVDSMLFDLSGGEGHSLDVELARQVLLALRATPGTIKPGVAGGLSTTSVGSITPLLKMESGLAWDAQGRVRVGGPHGELDPRKCDKFIEVSCNLIKKCRE